MDNVDAKVPLEQIDVESPDKLQTTEKQKAQAESAVQFAKYLTTRYPQVDDMHKLTIEASDGVHLELPELPDSLEVEPQLNYYIAGSLATTLLSRAGSIDLCEETQGSSITVTRSVVNPPETRTALAEFARPIGDIDYVPTDHYQELKKAVQDSYGKVSDEEYQKGRSKYLWKGGGGPSFDELPKEALPAVNRGENSLKVMCDPVEMYGTKKFARINLEGHDYYIARPDTIIGYKMLHMLQSYDQKPEKFNIDFARLHKALLGLYSEDEMVGLTHQILAEYEARMARVSAVFDKLHEPKLPKMAQDLLAKLNLGAEARSFMSRVVAYDQDHGQLLSTPVVST